jgi:hypothetical protein
MSHTTISHAIAQAFCAQAGLSRRTIIPIAILEPLGMLGTFDGLRKRGFCSNCSLPEPRF